MEKQQIMQIKRYLDIAYRRKELILSCALLGVTCGLIFYMTQPKVFSSEALLSYQEQAISPSQMSPDEQESLREIVDTFTQIVMSRSNLERIILENDLYAELRKNVPLEGVVKIFQGKTNITPSRIGTTFIIEHRGNDPEKVAFVTNTLASGFIEENLKFREERASGTSSYTQNELDMAKELLDQKEEVMRDYKLKHYNEMPDQRDMNLSRLIALQAQYQGKQESIQDLERTKVLVQDQINARMQILEQNRQDIVTQQAIDENVSTTSNTDPLVKLEILRENLVQLEDRYTDQHPQVKRIHKQIAFLEKLIEEEDRTSPEETGLANRTTRYDDELFDLQIQLKDIDLNKKKLEQEKEEMNLIIQTYDDWVALTPIIEAEWSSLTREHAELRRHYDHLVAQNLQAQSALNLEINQKGSQFRISDPARVSETPIEPDFNKVMAFALLAGLVLGGSLSVGLEFLDTSFRSQFEVEQELDFSVICSVPSIPLSWEVAKKRFWSLVKTVIFIIWIIAICLVLFGMWTDNVIIATFMEPNQ